MIKWKLEELSIKDLKEHPKNPRQIKKDQFDRLSGLIDKFGLIDKPIINTDMTIIGGHQRIRVLKKKKVKVIECWVADRQLTDEEIDELCIGLNLHQGAWDFDILANMWDPIDLLNYGFTEDQLLGDCKQDITEVLGEDDAGEEQIEPPKEEDAITKPGDLYVLGDHLLICGDSTDSVCVSRVLDGKEVILMVTDVPYGVSYDASWREGQVGKKPPKSKGKVLNDNKVDWSIAYSLFKGFVAYVWHSGKHSAEVARNLESCEYEIISQIIWAKQNFAISRGNYHWKHEPCWYAVKKGHNQNWKGDRKQTTIWEIPNLSCFGKSKDEDTRTDHSTQKPLECMGRPIQNHTDPGDWVYDPFLGSGTTLIAAERLGRKCIGIELSPVYCDVIVKRYANFMEKQGKIAAISRNGEKFSLKTYKLD